MFVSPPDSYVKALFLPLTPCSDIRRWRSWKVIKIGCGLEGGAFVNGISDLVRVPQELASFSSPHGRMQ